MIPPFRRRCPDCGHVDRRGRFDADGTGHAECPACGRRFEPAEGPWLN